MSTPWEPKPRRAGGSLLIAGLAFAGLGLLTVVWAAAPLLGAVGSGISDQLGGVLDWQVPAWVGKLLLALGFFVVAGILFLVGSGRWLAGLFGSARRRRATAIGGAPGIGAPGIGDTSASAYRRSEGPYPPPEPLGRRGPHDPR